MKRTALFCLTAALLAGCGDTTVKETLGIDSRAPDEFRVVSRPPLSVPPQFNLRPPGLGDSDTESLTHGKAEEPVLGGSRPNKTATTADQLFLQKAGANEADPAIKQKLAEQRIEQQLKKEEQGWWDRISLTEDRKEPIVKAEDEAERIKKNKEEGKPVNEGEVPQTSDGPISTLEHWFGLD